MYAPSTLRDLVSSGSSTLLAAALALAALTTGAGCALSEAGGDAGGDGSAAGDALATGRIEMPLVAIDEDGAVYRLDDISLQLTGSTGSSVFVAAATDATSLAAPAHPGVVSVRLLQGWSMQRSLDGGASFSPIGAVVASLNPASVSVFANTSSALAFDFLVREASGTVNVRFAARKTTGQMNGVMYPQQATGALAPYRHGQLSLSLFFSGSFIPFPQEGLPSLSLVSYTTALEFADDAFGVMSEQVAPQMSGYTLVLDVVSKVDGTQELGGSFTHNFTSYEPILTFGPAPLHQPLASDEQGYPIAGAMAAQLPFTLELNDEEGSMMSGVLNLQYAPNGS